MIALAWTLFALAVIPAVLAAVNLLLYRPPAGEGDHGSASVLIPARNEAARIGATLEAACRDPDPGLEIVVMDDHSDDGTAEIVRSFADRDPRVRLERAPELPDGWCGKQHACARLAEAARGDVLVFVDADVHLEPGAVSAAVRFLDRSGAALVSGFPRQETGTVWEKVLIPLIHFVLLGFLPMPGMRWTARESFAAGCGQWMVARKEAYVAAGGHGTIRSSRHDGVALPRSFRRAGFRTDLFDATRLASCRMYASAGEVCNGLAKNADEGMASSWIALAVWTVLLGGGQVLPAVLLPWAWASGSSSSPILGAAVISAYATRAALAIRFRQSWLGVLLHPLGVASLLAIQYWARLRLATGRRLAWRGRTA